MKIKEVCQQTGLTDRTVRYYIECGLLTPNNSESYTGRRSFRFSAADVERLETIKVLRDAGFSVEQIKTLQHDRFVREVVQERLRELEEEKEVADRLYESLKKADLPRKVSMNELVIILSSDCPLADKTVLQEDAPVETNDSYAGWKIVLFVLPMIVWCCLVYNVLSAILVASVIGLILWLLRKRSKRVQIVSILGMCGVLLAVGVTGYALKMPKSLDLVSYELIDRVPWQDEAFLREQGFYKVNDDTFKYTPMITYPDGLEVRDPKLTVMIHMNPLQDGDAAVLDDDRSYTKYGEYWIKEDIQITEDFKTFINGWFSRSYDHERLYRIQFKDYYISVHEKHQESPDIIYFEQLLVELALTVSK